MFYPISIKKAFILLNELPTSTDLENAIKLSQTIGVSKNRARIYLRALKKWGFIEGEAELRVKKLSYEEYIQELHKKFMESLPPTFFEAIKLINISETSVTPELLVNKLAELGTKMSLWKIRIILSNLRAIGALRIQKCVIMEKKFKKGLERIILNLLYESGCISTKKLYKILQRLTPYSTTEIHMKLLSLIKKGYILTRDIPQTLLELLKNAEAQNELLVIPLETEKIGVLREELKISKGTEKLSYLIQENILKIDIAKSEIRICPKIG